MCHPGRMSLCLCKDRTMRFYRLLHINFHLRYYRISYEHTSSLSQKCLCGIFRLCRDRILYIYSLWSSNDCRRQNSQATVLRIRLYYCCHVPFQWRRLPLYVHTRDRGFDRWGLVILSFKLKWNYADKTEFNMLI